MDEVEAALGDLSAEAGLIISVAAACGRASPGPGAGVATKPVTVPCAAARSAAEGPFARPRREPPVVEAAAEGAAEVPAELAPEKAVRRRDWPGPGGPPAELMILVTGPGPRDPGA